MTSPPDRQPRAPDRTPLRVEIAPPAQTTVPAEVHQAGDVLVGAFHLPMVTPKELKYHVGRRTITVWSRKPGHEFQSILVLPRWVRSDSYVLSHRNGVFEFLLEIAPTPLPM